MTPPVRKTPARSQAPGEPLVSAAGGLVDDGDKRPQREQPQRLGRFEALDKRPVNLDGFAAEDHEAGLVAFASASDPEPGMPQG
jgi:hypothetical protein